MRFDLVGLAPHYVYATTVGFPARYARGVVLVRIGDALIILVAVLVFLGVGVRVASPPEIFDEVFAFLVGLQSVEGLFLFFRNDVGYIFVDPLLVGLL